MSEESVTQRMLAHVERMLQERSAMNRWFAAKWSWQSDADRGFSKRSGSGLDAARGGSEANKKAHGNPATSPACALTGRAETPCGQPRWATSSARHGALGRAGRRT